MLTYRQIGAKKRGFEWFHPCGAGKTFVYWCYNLNCHHNKEDDKLERSNEFFGKDGQIKKNLTPICRHFKRTKKEKKRLFPKKQGKSEAHGVRQLQIVTSSGKHSKKRGWRVLTKNP